MKATRSPYSITSGNDAGMFAIDHYYGNITYTGTGEDAESETTSYELMVNASDGGASSDSMVTVTVTDANDNAPCLRVRRRDDLLHLHSGGEYRW